MNSAEREGKSPAKKRKPKSPPPASPEDSAGHTQADTALQESESRYRTVFESTGTAMVIIEEDTTIGFANKEFFRLTGYSQEDIDARKTWTEFVHRDDREKMIAQHKIRRTRPKDALIQYEFRLITKSGEIRNILLTIDMFPGTQRSIASLIDVTDTKRVDDALTASESRLRGIIRVAPIGIGVVVNRVILEVNDQICTMTGYSAGELIGQSARVFYPTQADFEYVGREKYEQIARKGSGVVETRWQRKDGKIIDILLSSTPLNPTDLSAGVTFTALDITEQKHAEEALRQSELQYRNLAETIQDFIITTDFDGIIMYANPVAQNLVGGSGLVGRALKEFMDPEQVARHRELLNARRQGLEGTISLEWHLKSPKDGSPLLLDIRSSLLKDQGKPSGVLFNARDITERKRMDETLRKSEEKYRLIAENTADNIWIYDMDLRLQYVSPSIEKMKGFTAEESLSQSLEEMMTPASLEALMTRFNQEMVLEASGTADPHRTVSFETEEYCKSGATILVENSVTLLRDAQGRPIGMLGVSRDITERKKSEEALLKSETRYRELFELLPQTIFEIDCQGKITSVNPAGLKLFGYVKEDLGKGVSAFEIFAPKDHQRLAENIQRIMRGELSGGFEYTAQRKDGSTFPVITYSVPIIQEHTAEGLRGVLVDISEQKAAEEALLESEDRFRTLADAAMEGIMIHDRGIILDCNPQFAKLFGYKPEEIIGKNGFEFLMTAESLGAISRWKQNGAKGMIDIIAIKKDGTRFSGETASTTILWQGKLRSIVQMNDITERKRAAEALRVANEKYSKAFLSAPDAITISELDSGRFIEVNDAASTIFGYSSDEMIGKSALELGIWLNKEERGSFVDKIRAVGRVVQYEVIQRRKSGEKYYASVTADTIAIGNSPYLIAIIRDITGNKHMEEALRVSEEKYRIVSEMAKDGIAIVQNNKLVYVNPSLAHIGGYSVEELTGASFLRFVAPESVVDLLAIIKNALLGKPVPEFFSTKIRHRDGHTIEIEANGTTIIWEGKKALLGIVRDITERRQAEKALQESQDLYQTLAESSPDMVYLIDREGYIRYVNSLAARQFRLSPTDLMGKRVEDLFPADSARHHMVGITRVITTGQPQFSEIFESFPTQDYWINARLNPVKDAKGVVTHVLGISTDISEHKRAEQALKDDEAKLRTVFESIQAGIVIIDLVSHKIVDINSVASSLIGAPKEKIIGQVCHKFICPAAEGMCPICDLNQTVDNSERILLTMNKKEVPILKTVVPIMLNGRQHLLESFIDISERKRAEEELLALNRDLEGKILERTEGLNNSLKDKELLLREIHHRVKNNLQIIISLLNLQSRYITDEKTLAAIRESQNRVKAMALVHEKLYQSADIAKINLDDYVQFLGNSLFQFYGMRGKGITFTTAIPEITLDINTAIPIGLIINELVSNSLKYAFPDGRKGEISIAMKREGHIVTILFKDTGISIPADFDWRNAKSLGLRLVISLVEQLSGTIEVDRAAGTAYTIVVKEKE